MHPERRRHVVGDLANRLALVAGELEWQRLLEARGQRTLQLEPDPRPRALRQMPGARLDELLVEQLVEREPPPPELRIGDLRRPMHQLERAPQLDQLVALAECGRMGIGDERQKLVEMLLNQRANL